MINPLRDVVSPLVDAIWSQNVQTSDLVALMIISTLSNGLYNIGDTTQNVMFCGKEVFCGEELLEYANMLPDIAMTVHSLIQDRI